MSWRIGWLALGLVGACSRPATAPEPAATEAPTAAAPNDSTPPPAVPAAEPEPLVKLSRQDHSRTVPVVAGQQVVLTLPSNPTTGHDWLVAETPAPLGPPESRFVPPTTDAFGAGGHRVFTWTIPDDATGEHQVELVYRRPQDKVAPPAETFTVTLRVGPR